MIDESRCEVLNGVKAIHHTVYRDQSLFNVLSTATRGDTVIVKRKYMRAKVSAVEKRVPSSVLQYRRHKSGVDMSTRFIKSLGLFRRDAKWTTRLFKGLLGLSVLNSKRIYEVQVRPNAVQTHTFVVALGLQLTHYGV